MTIIILTGGGFFFSGVLGFGLCFFFFFPSSGSAVPFLSQTNQLFLDRRDGITQVTHQPRWNITRIGCPCTYN